MSFLLILYVTCVLFYIDWDTNITYDKSDDEENGSKQCEESSDGESSSSDLKAVSAAAWIAIKQRMEHH